MNPSETQTTVRMLVDEEGNVFVRADDVMEVLKQNRANINSVANQYNQLLKSFEGMVVIEKIKNGGQKK